MKLGLFLLFLVVSQFSWAQDFDDDGFEIVNPGPSEVVLEQINAIYEKEIQPIFQSKCLNCHGQIESLPWYSIIPGVSHLIERDIREAQKAMNMKDGFPFKGHGSVKDDLTALRRVVDKKSMPPLQYKLLHWKSSLSDNEAVVIKTWIDLAHRKLE
tara:strand:- start:6731 stop:7198 length:468 start_codon:yes stop_codon:yes gene_type:complete